MLIEHVVSVIIKDENVWCILYTLITLWASVTQDLLSRAR